MCLPGQGYGLSWQMQLPAKSGFGREIFWVKIAKSRYLQERNPDITLAWKTNHRPQSSRDPVESPR